MFLFLRPNLQGSIKQSCNNKVRRKNQRVSDQVLNFNSHLEKSLNWVKVLENYLISLLVHEKSLKFSNLYVPYRFSDKLNDFAMENLSSSD